MLKVFVPLPKTRRMPHTALHGFSLLELIVVIAVLAVLLALLMPALQRAVDEAHTITCASNQRQLAVGAVAYAVDHDNRLPGTVSYGANQVPVEARAWAAQTSSGSALKLLENAPRSGTLWDYVGDADAYRCPELRPGRPGSGLGSNGKFDYAMMTAFSGASFDLLPGEAVVLDERVSTPLFVEEHPQQTINHYSGIESAHDTQDRLGNWHPGGDRDTGRGNYVAVDGSMHAIYTDRQQPVLAQDWFARPPKGAFDARQMPKVYGQDDLKGLTSLGINLDLQQTGTGWGDWDRR